MPSRKPFNAPAEAGAVLAAALDPIITINARGMIQSASDSVQRVFGWTPDELVGRNVSVLMPEPHRSAHDGYLDRYARTGRTHILNTPRRFDARRKDGSVFPIELSVSRADVPNRASPLFVGIIRDMRSRAAFEKAASDTEADRTRLQALVTEQTTALEAAHLRLRMADRLASIGTLAAGLGHDMNNVLLPVRARLNVLRAACQDKSRGGRGGENSPPGPASLREHVEGIAKSVAYLQQLADGLHYLAQDPDNVRPDNAATDLHSWWKQTGVVIAKALPKHVKLTASLSPDLPLVSVAPHRLTQAVLNLVVNAGEAIPPLAADPRRKRRQGRVRVWAKAIDDGCWVQLAVTDNGAGMTPEVKRRAFELFFTTKARGHGTGLGLPLAYKVAARAGGRIEIDSEVGKGTTVTMTLPTTGTSTRSNKPAPIRAAVTITDGRTAAMVRHVLEAAGCEVVIADVPPHPPDRSGDVQVWIADAGAAKHAAAAARRKDGRVAGTWAKRGEHHTVIIDAGSDFDAIRAAVARGLSGGAGL